MRILGKRSPSRGRGPKRHSPLKALVLTAVTGFALVAGIGVIGDRVSRAHNAVKASTPAPTTPTPGPPSAGTSVGASPGASPDARRVRALLGALREIDPALGTAPGRGEPVGRARASCRDLAEGTDRAEARRRVRARFGETVVTGSRKAERVLTAIERTLCPP
ncbi:hypothetical protein ACFYY8_22550 [Streptosporangium sp. NPDC001559]|uniref:hypothetical protein n=1 Tax=Streptosporangium sp. NPDC001559 TaxID=3366187 RepID=UPI0036EBFB43